MNEERFWQKVDKSGDCWEWQAARCRSGYGKVGRSDRAHRVAYRLTRGPIPPGMFVCHTCDNPPCVRPDHLFLGTNTENLADMYRKGRGPVGDNNGMRTMPHRRPVGSRNGQSKLTEAAVLEIRQRLANGDRASAIARDYGVSHAAIWLIQKGRAWKHAA